jgi:hypothetical protein
LKSIHGKRMVHQASSPSNTEVSVHQHRLQPLQICLNNNSTEQSPSCDANSRTADEDFLLPNPKVHCGVYNISPLPVLSHMNPVHILPSSFLIIHVNIILQKSLSLSSGLYTSQFSAKILYALQVSLIRATCSTQINFLILSS